MKLKSVEARSGKVTLETEGGGSHLKDDVENYRKLFAFYPEKVLADQIYCTREKRKWLKDNKIKLAAKPLGRKSAKKVANQVRPGERNPVEGKFGQAKNGYGMNRIRATQKNTSQSWMASIILVLNLVRLAGMTLVFLGFSAWEWMNHRIKYSFEAIPGSLKSKT